MACSGCPRCEPRLDVLPPADRPHPDAARDVPSLALDKVNDKMTADDIRALGMELNDARDDLNDALKRCEKIFLEKGVLPGWLVMKDDDALSWDGIRIRHFLVSHRNTQATAGTSVTETSLRVRILAAGYIEKLYLECTRKRP